MAAESLSFLFFRGLLAFLTKISGYPVYPHPITTVSLRLLLNLTSICLLSSATSFHVGISEDAEKLVVLLSVSNNCSSASPTAKCLKLSSEGSVVGLFFYYLRDYQLHFQ